MTIDWWTLGLQALNFLVLVWLLRRFLFQPVRRVIEKRRTLADQAFAEADEAKAAAADEAERLKAAQAELARDRQEMINKLHAEMTEERKATLDDAKRDAEKIAADSRAQLDDERRKVVAEMKGEIARTAADLAATLLAGLEAPAVDRAVLAKAKTALGKLPAGEVERLKGDIASDGGTVTVVTAAPLDGMLQEAWRTTIAEAFGSNAEVRFDADAEILGGVELRFPHAALRFTWAEELRQATEAMAGDDAA